MRRPIAIIDTWALAAPGEQDSRYTAEQYLPRLLALHELCQCDCIPVALSKKAGELLITEDVYPLRPTLARPVFPHRLDVLRIVNWMLDRVPKVEDYDGIAELVLEDVSLVPHSQCWVRTAGFRQHLLELLARALLADDQHEDHVARSVVLSGCLEYERVETQGTVALVETNRPDENRLLGAYAGSVDVVPDPGHVLRCIQPAHLWSSGLILEAVMLEVHQAQESGNAAWPMSPVPFTLGPDFIQSAVELGFVGEAPRVPALLRACRETILGNALADIHPIRVGRSGGAKDLTSARDGSKAWRRDIDYEYHLLFWARTSGPELANVVKHKDNSIVE
jgi:hypothetical protein